MVPHKFPDTHICAGLALRGYGSPCEYHQGHSGYTLTAYIRTLRKRTDGVFIFSEMWRLSQVNEEIYHCFGYDFYIVNEV